MRTTSGSSVSPHDIAAHCQVNPIGFFNRPLRPCWTFDYNRRFLSQDFQSLENSDSEATSWPEVAEETPDLIPNYDIYEEN